MNTTQMSLELAVSKLGVSDQITLMVSEERDKEIAEEQSNIYSRWKEINCNGN